MATNCRLHQRKLSGYSCVFSHTGHAFASRISCPAAKVAPAPYRAPHHVSAIDEAGRRKKARVRSDGGLHGEAGAHSAGNEAMDDSATEMEGRLPL